MPKSARVKRSKLARLFQNQSQKEQLTVTPKWSWIGARFPVLSTLLVLTLSPFGNAAEMKAGVAKVDITPPLGVHMWGYFDRLTGAEGILDPLYARVLVLETAGQQLAYVDLDLGRTFGPASLDRLRAAAKKDSGIDNVIVQATHTHA